MNLFAISNLSVAISCVVLSLLTLLFGKTKLHRLLLFFNIVVAIWGIGLFFVGISDAEPEAILGWKIAHLGGFFVGVSFYHMVCSFCGIRRKGILYFGYMQAIFFVLVGFGTEQIFNKVRVAFNIYFLEINPLYIVGVVFYLLFLNLSYYELLQFFRRSKGYKRTQALYIIFGFMVGFIGANFTFLPMFRIDIIYPFGNFGITLYVLILTYAILRHRLMDIHLVFRRTMAYSLSAGLLTGFFIVLVLFVVQFVSDFSGITSFTVIVIAALFIASIFAPLKTMIQSLVDRVFYKTTYNYYATVQGASRELATIVETEHIYEFIVNTIFSTLRLSSTCLLSAGDKNFKVIHFISHNVNRLKDTEDVQKIASDSELVGLLYNRNDIIIREELPMYLSQDTVDIIEEELRPLAGEMVVPIFMESKLAFFLVLGEKLSGDLFSDEDISLLRTMANQSAVSLKNAKLYDELELRVKQRTAEFLDANELLKKEIIERKKVEKQLEHIAFYDSLTNLPNRTSFMERLRILLERKKRYKKDYLFAVFFLDADRFKVINDSLGHLIGDQLLVMIAQRLKNATRGIDTVARFGGDEFAILLDDIKKTSDVNLVAERIHDELKTSFNLHGHEVFTTVSIGITTSEANTYTNPEDIMRDADIALYSAKERGKACHVVFDAKMHTKAVTVLTVESELRRALENNELRLYYQPILSVEDKSIKGFEALVRWQHPDRGLILPAEFIMLAEETNLILPIGKWILREACGQMRLWQDKFPAYRDLTVSVNISTREFSQPNFAEMVEKILRDTSLDGRHLKLEITERMIVVNPEVASKILRQLNELNIQFDIDDFGTGHSALGYLRHFPINALKIDRSFISTLGFDRYNSEIVKTIILLASNLQLDVIAEGIETEEQLKSFMGMKGKYAQGYLFYKPMDSMKAGALLAVK